MLFNSLTFLLFFAIVFGSFWLMPTWPSKKRLLLIASYVFYGAWSPPYVLLLVLSTAMDWHLAKWIDRTNDRIRRRYLLMLSVACNLGLLGYFKYGDFLLQNFTALLSSLGIAYDAPAMGIVLPVGISFYTFASLSYTVDVYRREIQANASYSDYALFVSFFPHLVAGPIVRASYLLPQIASPRLPSRNEVGWGAALVVIGLFAKVVMADALFSPVVDRFYASPEKFGTIDAWIAVLSFSGQIYYDFSGYSLCAIGLAMCFGFSFPDNFQQPYAARGFSDFWRRWHISLSAWLRDYLYIPLGGNRHGPWRTYAALLATMFIGGLWHGASWMFVLWGALHGLYLAVERAFKPASRSEVAGNASYGVTELLVFIIVTLTWIPFRSATPTEAGAVITSLFRVSHASMSEFQDLLALAGMLMTLKWQATLRDSSIEDIAAKYGSAFATAVLTLCLVALFLNSGGDQRAFIYFQF